MLIFMPLAFLQIFCNITATFGRILVKVCFGWNTFFVNLLLVLFGYIPKFGGRLRSIWLHLTQWILYFCYKRLYLGSPWKFFHHSENFTHLVYITCIGFYVDLLLVHRVVHVGTCRADELSPHLIQPSFLLRRQGIAVMCSSLGNHADVTSNSMHWPWDLSVFSRYLHVVVSSLLQP